VIFFVNLCSNSYFFDDHTYTAVSSFNGIRTYAAQKWSQIENESVTNILYSKLDNGKSINCAA